MFESGKSRIATGFPVTNLSYLDSNTFPYGQYLLVIIHLMDSKQCTVMCLNIGTPTIINFPFVPNGKLIIFRCTKIQIYYSLIMMCLNIGAPKMH